MRFNLLFISSALLLLFLTNKSFSQVPATPPKENIETTKPSVKVRKTWQRDSIKSADQTLNGQYRFLLSRSRTSADGYKLVAPNRLTSLWTSVTDTLKKERAERRAIQQKLIEQEKSTNYLKTEISRNESSINSYSDKLNEISFLGISFEKGTYNIIVWSLISVLAIALIILVITSGSKIAEGKHRIQLYDELSEEYQTFKSKTVEKERKLARELQDERNRLDELLNKR